MPPRREIIPKGIEFSGDDKRDFRSSRSSGSWRAELHGTYMPDTTSGNAKSIEFLKGSRGSCERVNTVIDVLDAAANAGRFSESFSKNKNNIEKMLINLKKNEPAAFNLFHHMVQAKKDLVWKPLKDLTEQVISRDDSTPSISRTQVGEQLHRSDNPGSATPIQRDFPSVPTIEPERAEYIIRWLNEVHDTMKGNTRLALASAYRTDVINDLTRTQHKKPGEFEYIVRHIEEKLTIDETWKPLKDIVDFLKKSRR